MSSSNWRSKTRHTTVALSCAAFSSSIPISSVHIEAPVLNIGYVSCLILSTVISLFFKNNVCGKIALVDSNIIVSIKRIASDSKKEYPTLINKVNVNVIKYRSLNKETKSISTLSTSSRVQRGSEHSLIRISR